MLSNKQLFNNIRDIYKQMNNHNITPADATAKLYGLIPQAVNMGYIDDIKDSTYSLGFGPKHLLVKSIKKHLNTYKSEGDIHDALGLEDDLDQIKHLPKNINYISNQGPDGLREINSFDMNDLLNNLLPEVACINPSGFVNRTINVDKHHNKKWIAFLINVYKSVKIQLRHSGINYKDSLKKFSTFHYYVKSPANNHKYRGSMMAVNFTDIKGSVLSNLSKKKLSGYYTVTPMEMDALDDTYGCIPPNLLLSLGCKGCCELVTLCFTL